MSHPGIPHHITVDFAREWVRPRNSPRRFQHICGVVDVATDLADRCGEDLFLAELSAWLHDACKEMKDRDLVQQAKQFHLPLDPILEENGHLLHGPVAAATAKSELGITNEPVLNAISEHTLGAAPMSDLSKIIFLADCLESSRPEDYTAPIWHALGPHKRNLDLAMLAALEENLKHLQSKSKPIHPRTIEVRNYFRTLTR